MIIFSITIGDPLFLECWNDVRKTIEIFESDYIYKVAQQSVEMYFRKKYPHIEEWPKIFLNYDDDINSFSGQFVPFKDKEKSILFKLQMDL